MRTDVKIYKFFGDKNQDYDEIIQSGCYVDRDKTIDLSKIFFMEQVHSDQVYTLTVTDVLCEGVLNHDVSGELIQEKNILLACDGIVSNQKDIYLAIKTADCFPIFLYDEKKAIIGVAHSGREGTKLQIIAKIIDMMQEIYHCSTQDIICEIGPGICHQHYQVSPDLALDFYQTLSISEVDYYLDLQKIIYETALKKLLQPQHIITNSICTFENTNYYSYRRNQILKRQVSLLGMENV